MFDHIQRNRLKLQGRVFKAIRCTYLKLGHDLKTADHRAERTRIGGSEIFGLGRTIASTTYTVSLWGTFGLAEFKQS